VHVGVTIFPTDYSISITELARACEELGFESLWVPEHTHIPTSRRSPRPGGPALPRHYLHTLDPFIALGMAAAVTRTLKLGTGVCLVVERDPITTAKEVATLDFVSDGRFLFGIGAGWNEEEMQNHGTDPSTRFRLLRERVRAMQTIWTHDEAEFHGRYVDFDPVWQWPKPVQKPHPPIFLGGHGPNALRRVIEYGDEWLPIPARVTSLTERIAELNRLAAAAGRGRIPVSVFQASTEPAEVEQYAAAGVNRCIFNLPSAPAVEVLPRLRQYAELRRMVAA
jgi:probable F420-dependent oxidoreductase